MSDETEKTSLPTDREYFLVPAPDQELVLQTTEKLAREYESYADHPGMVDEEVRMNREAAREVRSQVNTSVTGTAEWFMGEWVVELANGDEVHLLDNLESSLDFDSADQASTGYISVSNIQGLTVFDPAEHPGHDVIQAGGN